ncbi:hypothetical protein DFS34DRAFT_598702 [Phlyctochytrium arcticum]|nr:hypothetical protein DFS34DRAFT_598702 [Phlyctochytrium arcticum]
MGRVQAEPRPGTNKTATRTVFIADAKNGPIWRTLEWKRVLGNRVSKHGSILRVHNGSAIVRKPLTSSLHSSNATAPSTRAVPFTCVCFSREMIDPIPHDRSTTFRGRDFEEELLGGDGTAGGSSRGHIPGRPPSVAGFVMAAVDQRGYVWVFDFGKNKYWLVARSGVSGTCISFSSIRRRELILGLADCSLHCYNIDSCQLVAKLPAYHNCEPHQLSVHPTKPLAISTSLSEGIIWDTELWERKRLLVGAQNPIQQAMFSPDGSTIITGFTDSSILVWQSDTFALHWKITLEMVQNPGPDRGLDEILGDKEDEDQVLITQTAKNCMAISKNGEVLVYGGRGWTVYVWNMAEKVLLHEILVPAFENKEIIQAEFLGTSNIVALLADSGDLVFIDAPEARFVGRMEGRRKFKSFSSSPDGRLLSTIFLNPKSEIGVVRVDSLLYTAPREDEEEASSTTPDENSANSSDAQHPIEPVDTKQVVAEPAPQRSLYELVEMRKDTRKLNRKRLNYFLMYYYKYPEKYRSLIWRFLLRVPENHDSYEALLKQGVHPSTVEFRRRFPIKSGRVTRSMERVLSALAYWSPIFENLDYLPALIFPFVRVFLGDLFGAFEVIVTVLLNWCQKWWEYYPNPPIECLSVMEKLLAFHDGGLLDHFVKYRINSQIYAWLMMRTFFAQVVSGADWCMLWDHFITNEPDFPYYFLVAYLRSHRAALMLVTTKKDFEYFFTRSNPTVSTIQVLKAAYKIKNSTPDALCPLTFIHSFEPLPQKEYPVFNAYPDFIVNYQSKMKEKIRREEEEIGRRQKMESEVAKLTDELRRDKRAWEAADWKMNEMIDQWWEQTRGEEARHMERKARVESATTEQRAKSMRNIAEARRAFVNNHLSSTNRHLGHLTKAIGTDRTALDAAVDDELDANRLQEIEDEWIRRGREMGRVREILKNVEREKTERLIKGDTGLSMTDKDKQAIFERRRAMDAYGGFFDSSSASPAKSQPSTTAVPSRNEQAVSSSPTRRPQEVPEPSHIDLRGRSSSHPAFPENANNASLHLSPSNIQMDPAFDRTSQSDSHRPWTPISPYRDTPSPTKHSNTSGNGDASNSRKGQQHDYSGDDSLSPAPSPTKSVKFSDYGQT